MMADREMTPMSQEATLPETITLTAKELFFIIRAELGALSEHFSGLERRSMDQSRQAYEKIQDIEKDMLVLKLNQATKQAIDENKKQYQRLGLGVIIAILGMIANVILSYIRH